jgi:hypothetical protein
MTAKLREYGPIRLSAALPCPSCGHEFTGRWVEGCETAPQQCPACGRVFEATWPGFTFTRRTVFISREEAEARGRRAHDGAA